MLPSWRDEVRVALSPDRMALARVARGWRPKIVAKYALHFDATGPSDWHSCMDALQQALQEPAWQHADASVVISSHFVRYALVPWSEHLASDEEKRAWVQHHFFQSYGEPQAPAEYRWSDDEPNALCVASAVDGELLGRIRTAFADASLRVKSVQPYLMAAFNRCRPYVKGASAWVVLPESGRVCMAAIVNGQWRAITSKNMGDDWESELTLLLQRQWVLADDEVPAVVLAYGSELPSLHLGDGSDVPVKFLAPRSLSGFSPQTDGEYAMALTGVV